MPSTSGRQDGTDDVDHVAGTREAEAEARQDVEAFGVRHVEARQPLHFGDGKDTIFGAWPA